MPHAVIDNASTCPDLDGVILAREGGVIHKVLETWTHDHGWVHKSLITGDGPPTKLLVRVDSREGSLVLRLEDHLHVERTPIVFDHLALLTARVLEANPGATLGKTNLQAQLARMGGNPLAA